METSPERSKTRDLGIGQTQVAVGIRGVQTKKSVVSASASFGLEGDKITITVTVIEKEFTSSEGEEKAEGRPIRRAAFCG